MSRRVVVTGLGAVTSIGTTVESTWNALLRGVSGAVHIDSQPDFSRLTFRSTPTYAAPIPNPRDYIERFHVAPLVSANTLFYALTLAAAQEAIGDSRLDVTKLSESDRYRSGVAIGTAASDKPEMERTLLEAVKKGYTYMNKMSLTQVLPNFAGSLLCIKYGLKGYSITPVTACASGLQAIGEGYRAIKDGLAERMLVGGAEHSVSPYVVQAFASLRALSLRHSADPTKASKPFDKARDGFVLGEGAGVLVLEVTGHISARIGSGLSETQGRKNILRDDGYHLTKPRPNGEGLYHAIKAVLRQANMTAGDIDTVNAHAASTVAGDEGEIRALERIFGDPQMYAKKWLLNDAAEPKLDKRLMSRVCVTSNKGHIGHTLGAAGAIESILAIVSMERGVIPFTLNLEDPIMTGLQLVRRSSGSAKRDVRCVLKESMAFGGTNACVIFKKM